MDQNGKGIAGGLEAEEMPRKQDMGGGGYRNEFGQAFDKAKDKRTDDRLIGHELSFPEALEVRLWGQRRALADLLVFAAASSYSFF